MDFAAGSMGPKVDAAAPLRRGDRQAGGDRVARGHREDRRRRRRAPTSSRRRRTASEGATMTEFGVHSEVGKLRKVMVHRPELSLQAADAVEPRRPAVRRRPLGRAGPVRARPVRRARCASAASRSSCSRTSSPRRWPRATRAASGSSSSSCRSTRSAGRWSTRSASVLWRPQARPAGQAPHRRAHRRRGRASTSARVAKTSLIGAALDDTSQFVLPPLPEHAVHPRLVVLDLRRRVGQPDVLAGPPPRGLQRRRHLPGPPDVPGRGVRVLVPAARRRRPARARVDFGLASLEGGDVMPIGNGTVLIGMSERSQGRMIEQIARVAVRSTAPPSGSSPRDDEGPGPHAPRHRLHAARPRQGDGLPARSSSNIRAISLRPGHRRPGDFHVTQEPDFLGRRRRRPRRRQAARSSRPAATSTSRSGSSGTTATTSSPSSPASSSPTSATPTRSPRCARPASRSSRSRASSSARAAAAATA